jgi:hypothetical protein|nr:hypothetical protein [uncultured Capnocytophaga sp.]
MKKIFLFLVALVGIVACSKSDNGSSENGGNSGGGNITGYNPPSWIIGTWIWDTSADIAYTFSKTDICNQTLSSSTCALSNPEIITSVEQTISENDYTVKINLVGGSSINYAWRKISDKKIAKFDLKGQVTETYTKK